MFKPKLILRGKFCLFMLMRRSDDVEDDLRALILVIYKRPWLCKTLLVLNMCRDNLFIKR